MLGTWSGGRKKKSFCAVLLGLESQSWTMHQQNDAENNPLDDSFEIPSTESNSEHSQIIKSPMSQRRSERSRSRPNLHMHPDFAGGSPYTYLNPASNNFQNSSIPNRFQLFFPDASKAQGQFPSGVKLLNNMFEYVQVEFFLF